MTTFLGTPLSVLDTAAVSEGMGVGEALRGTIDLARKTEQLGYTRFWVAEHHGSLGIASSAPAVLIAHLAEATTTIRVGAGGVMLPNHSSLAVAEQFGTLEALHPGRIDLGLGRAPGTDRLTAYALRGSEEKLNADDFPEQLAELLAFFKGDFPEGHPYRSVTAVPGQGHLPAIWILGSSTFGARLAGELGLPFGFAHHFSAENTMPALATYRASFRRSAVLAEPYVTIAVSVICGDTDEQAEWLAGPSLLWFARLRTGRSGRMPSPEVAAAHAYTPQEAALVADRRRGGQVIGGPDTVRRRLEELLLRTRANELMITCRVFDHADRVRTYEALASLAC